MKKIFKTLAVLASLTAVDTQAEIRTVVVNSTTKRATIDIEEGEVGKCVFAKLNHSVTDSTTNYAQFWRRCAIIQIIKSDTTVDIKTPKQVHNYSVDISAYFPVVSGPAKVALVWEEHSSILTMDVTANESSNSKNNVTVLPKSTESMNLILESSEDMVNWTVDTTGTKNPSDKKRFYRLRAVKE